METIIVEFHIKKKQLHWIMNEFVNKCDKFALRVLCFNASLVIILMGYFSLLRLYNIADQDATYAFSNTLLNFSIKVFIYTILFFIIFVLFIMLIETLVYKIPRILIWSSLILPQTIIFSTKMEFPPNKLIPLTHSQKTRILDALSDLQSYVPHFHHLICLNHYNTAAHMNITNTTMIAKSLYSIIHNKKQQKHSNISIWNCDNQTALNMIDTSNQYEALSFTWGKLLVCIMMYLGQNYLFDCACIWSTSMLLTILIIILSMLAPKNSLTDNNNFCKLIDKFQDKEMEPIDRYFKLKNNIMDSVGEHNYDAVKCFKSMEMYLRSTPLKVSQRAYEIYLNRFSSNLNFWCGKDVKYALNELNEEQSSEDSVLIDGICEMETNEGIKSRKMMYNAGGDMYKVLLMIVALLWAYLCDVWIGISRIVYTQWRKRLLLFQYMPVDDVCDLIMQYQCTAS